MGCLNIEITRLKGIDVNIFNVLTPFNAQVTDVGKHLKADCAIVCAINDYDYILRFDKATLVWNGADNKEGVVKYNTLIATGAWSLEEIEIEELL